MTSANKDFSVAIVGGGMCGLACAVALIRGGVNVAVFEAAPKFGEVGAGVGLGPNAIRALRGLGILDPVLTKASQSFPDMRLSTFISGVNTEEIVMEFMHAVKTEGGDKGIGIYRPDFLEALLPLIDPKITHFNKRCVGIDNVASGRELLQFSDGSTFETDLVIGADGIKSAVRNTILGEDDRRLQAPNISTYRALVSIDALITAGISTKVVTKLFVWVGVGKAMVTYPIKDGAFLNVVAFAQLDNEFRLCPEQLQPWVQNVPHQDLLDAYRGWSQDAITILQQIKEPSRSVLHTLYPPLQTYVRGHVMLIGDAAHAMMPNLAAGVGQGLEDVYAIYKLLTHTKTRKENLDIVLAVYDKIRPPRAASVLENSLKMCQTYLSYGPGKYNAVEMRPSLTGILESVWNYDFEGEVSDAIKAMETNFAVGQDL